MEELKERYKKCNEKCVYLENQLALLSSIINTIKDVLDGKEVSDFEMSFSVVRAVYDLKKLYNEI